VRAICSAPTRTGALEAVKTIAEICADFKKATDKITSELDTLLVHYDVPVEHSVHLPTTNPRPSRRYGSGPRVPGARGPARPA
jgi:hypothetical protein